MEEDAVKPNELLFWLSARHEGSWQQFRAKVEELYSADSDLENEGSSPTDDSNFPVHQRTRLDLERLAHVEFFARECEEGWRVTPPILAGQQLSDGIRGVLCGARSLELLERILCAGEQLLCNCETLAVNGVPDVIRILGPNASALASACKQTGVLFQDDAPQAILWHLPPCDLPQRNRPQSEFPVGADWMIREFDAADLCWRNTDRRRARAARSGVFRFLLRYQRPRHFLRLAGSTYEMPRASAIYALLRRRRRRVLRYNRTNMALSLPAVCRPPRLLERALTLCSGIPPTFDPANSYLTYESIPDEVAGLAAQLLRQEMP
jgi:hypothetical protein